MAITELNGRDILSLTASDLKEVFARNYVGSLFAGHKPELAVSDIVDTIITICETGHPAIKGGMSPEMRRKMIDNLVENSRSGMTMSGIHGVENAMYHAIAIITRYLLATETRLTRVK
jgi:hypothetical protein